MLSLQDTESLQYKQGEGRMPNIFLRDSRIKQKSSQKIFLIYIVCPHQPEPVFQSPPWYELMALPGCQPPPHPPGTTAALRPCGRCGSPLTSLTCEISFLLHPPPFFLFFLRVLPFLWKAGLPQFPMETFKKCFGRTGASYPALHRQE